MIADPAMVSYHGADAARRFILTILNMVRKYRSFQQKDTLKLNITYIK